jgi:hypothetical protein
MTPFPGRSGKPVLAAIWHTCSTSTNRLVRTRMPGGVGGGVNNDPAYPIGRYQDRALLPAKRHWVLATRKPALSFRMLGASL